MYVCVCIIGDVKRHPDLERWNNVRDNVDQVPRKCSVYIECVRPLSGQRQ